MNYLREKLIGQFELLLKEGTSIDGTKQTSGGSTARVVSIPVTYVDHNRAQIWALNVLNLVRSAFGHEHDYYALVKTNLVNCAIYNYFRSILNCVHSAIQSIEAGYIFDTKDLIEAEVATDYLEQAELLLNKGYKDAAAVVCGSVLERHLRELCSRSNVPTGLPNGKLMAMNDLAEQLSKSGILNALRKKQITAWAQVRNDAAHGNYEAYTKDNVIDMIKFVVDFCAS